MAEKSGLSTLTQMKRLSLLIEYLQRKPYSPLDKILQYLKDNGDSISKETFHRLKRDVKEHYQIIIAFENSKQGYFYDEDKSLDKESFFNLLEIIVTADFFSQNFNEKNNALEFIEFENRSALKITPEFKTILDAIQNKQIISFEHFSFYRLEQKEYFLNPYYLKQYQNRWYVIGETENKFRAFGIDRIQNIKMTDKKFKPKTEEAKNLFHHVIGFDYETHPKQIVILEFDHSQKPYLISLPLHSSQKEIPSEKDKTFIIQLIIHPNFEFIQQILKYGSMAKIIEPKWLADHIIIEAKKILNNYK